jgi:hypothetical protein
MFRVEFWKCVRDFILLLGMYLKKDTIYSPQLVEDSVIECLRDMRSLKCHGCYHWKLKGAQDDSE